MHPYKRWEIQSDSQIYYGHTTGTPSGSQVGASTEILCTSVALIDPGIPLPTSQPFIVLTPTYLLCLNMHLTSHLSTLLPALVVTILFTITSTTSLSKEKRSVQMCSPHMACAWAICPYPSIPGPAYPEEEDCLYIENKNCKCASRCQLTDLFEPGRAKVKYEYRCMSPEITREIFPMSWRLRHAVPVIPS